MFTLNQSNLQLTGKIPGETFTVKRGDTRARFYKVDEYICRKMQEHQGFWEDESLSDSLQYLKPFSVVIDCGAHCGNHSIFYASHCAKVHAIEPTPGLFQLLTMNVALNNMQKKIQLHKKVLSNKKKRHSIDTFFCNRDAFFTRNWGTIQFNESESGDYVSCRLDDIVQEPVDLIKIDVEGAELAVLQGATCLLKDRPVVCVETHDGGRFVDTSEQLIRFLQDFGYVLHKGSDFVMKDKTTEMSALQGGEIMHLTFLPK